LTDVDATAEPPTPDDDSSKDTLWTRFVGLVTGNLPFVVSLAGAFAYFVVLRGQTSLYSKFGLEPEDVGSSCAETLGRAAAGLITLLVVVGICVALTARWRKKPGGSSLAGVSREKEYLGRVVAVLLVALGVCAVWLPVSYQLEANRVRDGEPVRPAGLTTLQRVLKNPLGIRVEPVRVTWIGETKPANDFEDDPVMYLGRADGTAAFFDPCTKSTVRVPDGDIVMTRKQHEEDAHCRTGPER